MSTYNGGEGVNLSYWHPYNFGSGHKLCTDFFKQLFLFLYSRWQNWTDTYIKALLTSVCFFMKPCVKYTPPSFLVFNQENTTEKKY